MVQQPIIRSNIPRKTFGRPNGAFKLLVFTIYGQYPYMIREPRGIIRLQSLRKFGRLLGVESKKVRKWLQFLEDQGYVESLSYSENRRQATFRVREPSNVIY